MYQKTVWWAQGRRNFGGVLYRDGCADVATIEKASFNEREHVEAVTF
jgi:hypothetical protein